MYLRIVLVVAAFLLCSRVFSQPVSSSADPSATTLTLNGAAVAVDLNNFQRFKQQVAPLVKEMAARRVVSLGEGTHGTSEFYKLRYWLTKILVEEKGFTTVAFESDYGDAWLLNQALESSRANIDSLLKKRVIAIWRNEEVGSFLQWLQAHNQLTKNKVRFSGLDMMFMAGDAAALQAVLKPKAGTALHRLLIDFVATAVYQDSLWYGFNQKDFKVTDTIINDNMVKAFETADAIRRMLTNGAFTKGQQTEAADLLANVQLQAEGAYNWVKFKKGAGGRDSAMAVMAKRMLRTGKDKLVIWAHDGHVARKPVLGGIVGGMGGFIEQELPGQYFVLGTGTAVGSFAATQDQFITHASKMTPFELDVPADSLWEGQLSAVPKPAFYLHGPAWQQMNTRYTNRFIGYFPESGKNSHDKSHPVNTLYDAYLFIRRTTASRFIE